MIRSKLDNRKRQGEFFPVFLVITFLEGDPKHFPVSEFHHKESPIRYCYLKQIFGFGNHPLNKPDIISFKEIKAENELALAYAGLGRLSRKKGDTAQARDYFTKALDIFERLGTLIELDKVKEELASLPEE